MALYAEEGHHNRIQSPFNGVMLVSKGDEILLKRSYGFYDKENNIPLKVDSKFLIGSISKQFTAMLVMQQVEKGTIDLDKPLSDYLPYVPKEKGQHFTIHRLLSHTTGLPHYEGVRRLGIKMGEFAKMEFTPTSYAQFIAQMELINQPGTEFYYSSFNYILLGALLEQVTGKTYNELLQQHIAIPLGLKNTGYANNEFVENNVAKGYRFREIGFWQELFSSEKGKYFATELRHQSNTFSTGGMHSTVDDLLAWSKAVKENTLLSKALTEKMLTPNLGGYAYGWFINHETMLRFNPFIDLVSHGGTLNGYTSNIAMYKDGITVIYLSNVSPVNDYRLTMNMHLAANGIEIDDFKRDIRFPELNDGYDAFVDDGGLNGVREYYAELTRRAGYQVTISQWGYQELIELHLEEEKFNVAEQLFNEMLSHYTTPSEKWLNTIGYDFLEHKLYKQAIAIFKRNIGNYQYSASAFDSLGDAYHQNGQLMLAKQNYQQAVTIASKSQSRHLDYFKEQLATVDKKLKQQ